MTAYCDAPGEENSGDVCVFRGGYHVVYILVKNDYIDTKNFISTSSWLDFKQLRQG